MRKKRVRTELFATLREDLRGQGLLIPSSIGLIDLDGKKAEVLQQDEDITDEDGFNVTIEFNQVPVKVYSIDLDYENVHV